MSGKNVLVFAPYGSWRIHHELDAVIGTALRLRGANLHALLCDGLFRDCPIAGKPPRPDACRACASGGAALFSGYRIPATQIRALLTPGDYAAAEEWSRDLPVSALATARFEGVSLGEFVRSSVHTYFLVGEIDYSTDRMAEVNRGFLYNGALIVRAFGAMIRAFPPDHALCFNGVHAYYRIFYELCKANGIPVLIHERGLVDDTFLVLANHSQGDHAARIEAWKPWENLPLDESGCRRVKDYFIGRERGLNTNTKPIYGFATGAGEARRMLRIPDGGKIVGLFTSSDWEVGISRSIFRMTFSSQAEWIRETARHCAEQGAFLVIRHHPNNAKEGTLCAAFLKSMMELNLEFPDTVRVIMPSERITSYGLLWSLDLAVTYFTTMGAETAIRGIPTLCLAESMYREMGMRYVTRREDYGEAIRRGLSRGRGQGLADLRAAYRFAHYLYFTCNMRFASYGIARVHSGDVRFRVAEDLLPGKDPALDRVCGHILDGAALLAPEPGGSPRGTGPEDAFLEGEWEFLEAGKAEARMSAPPVREPSLGVLRAADRPDAARAAAWDRGMARSRLRPASLRDASLPGPGGLAARLRSLARDISGLGTEFVYAGADAALPEECVLSASADFLADPAHAGFECVAWGGWVCDRDGDIQASVLDGKAAPAWDDVRKAAPVLDDPGILLALTVSRAAWLAERLEAWARDAEAGRPVAAAIFADCFSDAGRAAWQGVPALALYPEGGAEDLSEEELGFVFEMAGQLGKAERHYRKALVGKAGDRSFLERYAGILMRIGREKEAERVLSEGGRAPATPGQARPAPRDYAEIAHLVESVKGWLLAGQEKFLFDKVRSLPDGAVILEMGSDRGRSTCAMALACIGTRKRIFAIDTFTGNTGLMGKKDDYYLEWKANLDRLGVGEYVTGLQGYTFDILPKWDMPVDFTFIDASHEYIDVLNDLKLIYPHVKTGGWIAFHDVEPSWPGPWRVWLEYGMPLLTDHETVLTLACGRKSKRLGFGKSPESVREFSFARGLAAELARSMDPAEASFSKHLKASLEFGASGPEGRRLAIDSERAIAAMPPSVRKTISIMIAKDARLDGYLHYWLGLVLEAEGKTAEAMDAFTKAARVSRAVPAGQLRRGPETVPAPPGSGAGELFRPHLRSTDTVIQLGSADGSLLLGLPGGFKIGLERDDELRKRSSLGAGIDSVNDAAELPLDFADAVIGHGSLGTEKDPLGVLVSLRKRLHPNGIAVFTAPVEDGRPAHPAEDALYSWTRSSFANLFAAAGFVVRETRHADIPGAGRFIHLVAEASGHGTRPAMDRDWAMVGAPSPAILSGDAKMDPRDIPVALVAYRRPAHTQRVLESLERHGVRNLYVFCDGAKGNSDETDVREVGKLIEGIRWVRPEIQRAGANRGLAASVMAAADHVLSRHETLVLLEDDCVPHRHFFDFMAAALGKYGDCQSVYGVSGYTVPMGEELLRRYPYDVYFSPRIGSWGWATWRRAWRQLDRDLVSICRKALDAKVDFDQGGNDIRYSIEGMLQGQVKDVWTLPWVLSVYLKGGCFAYPTVSHIDNIGMDGTGVHCGKTDRYLTRLAEAPAARFPDQPFLDPGMIARFRSFYDLAPQKA